jgi:hypothetical protein
MLFSGILIKINLCWQQVLYSIYARWNPSKRKASLEDGKMNFLQSARLNAPCQSNQYPDRSNKLNVILKMNLEV